MERLNMGGQNMYLQYKNEVLSTQFSVIINLYQQQENPCLLYWWPKRS